MANIRVNSLPSDASPSASDVTVIDGATTRKTTLTALVDAGRPLADQAEAEAGTDAAKAMTPLTTAQAIAALGAGQFASTAQGATADSALQPGAIGVTVQAYNDLLSSAATLPVVAGDILYGSGADELDRLPAGTDGQVIRLAAGLPVWSDASGLGDLLAANNLNDLDDTGEARSNLAVPPVAATRTALAGHDASKDTVVDLIESGFSGRFLAVDNTGGAYDDLIAADAASGEIKVTTGNPNLAFLRQRKNGDLFKTSEHGGGVLGFYRAQQAAAERIKLFGAGSMAFVEINEVGTIGFAASDIGVVVPPNVSLLGLGKGKTIIDCAAVTTPNLIDHATGLPGAAGRRFMDIRPLTGSFAALYSVLPSFTSISARSTFVDFGSAHGLAIGDIFIVYAEADNSWMATRPEYRMGDRFKVLGVDGNRVYVDHGFRDDYVYSVTPGAEVRAYKQTVRGGRFGGFTIATAGSGVATLEGAAFNSCDGLRVDDFQVWDAGENGFQVNQCFEAIVDHSDGTTILSDGTTSVYPFSFRNSTKCRVKNGSFSGDWHSIDMGGYNEMGAVLNYDCVAEDIDGFGSGQSTTAAHTFNVHGNSDMCGFRRCKGNGYGFGGRDTFFDDGELVLAGSATAAIKLVHAGEVWGGRHRISRTKMYSNRNGTTASTGGAIYLDIDEAKAETFIQLWDVDIDMPAEQQPMRLVSSGTNPYPISLDFRGRANTPTATVLGLLRIIGPTVASTSSHIRINVADLPNGVPYATSSGTFTAREWDFGIQKAVVSITPTASATFNGTTVTFNHAYPQAYTPQVYLQVQGPAGGTKTAARPAALPTTTSFVPQLYTGDGTNLTAAATSVAWHAI